MATVVRRVGSGERRVVMATACDAVLDSAVSVEGRGRLVEANGLVYLIRSVSYSNDVVRFERRLQRRFRFRSDSNDDGRILTKIPTTMIGFLQIFRQRLGDDIG